eukprot:SAG22_NODE_3596_length_1626_cov_2.592665_2_plen_161_part_00
MAATCSYRRPDAGPATCIKPYVLDEVFPTQELLMVKIDVQGGEAGVLKGMTKMITERRVKYIYFEYTKVLAEQKMMDDAGYMCYDHAQLFSHSKVPFRLKGLDVDARPGDELTLSNGLKWREYYVKTRPSEKAAHMKARTGGGMQQTDLFCFRDDQILDH